MPFCQKSCGEEIVFAETPAGKLMPLNAQPSADGQEWTYVNGKTWKATEKDRKLQRPLHVPHWATCPNANDYRRKR